jgi:hypothetical protein
MAGEEGSAACSGEDWHQPWERRVSLVLRGAAERLHLAESERSAFTLFVLESRRHRNGCGEVWRRTLAILSNPDMGSPCINGGAIIWISSARACPKRPARNT